MSKPLARETLLAGLAEAQAVMPDKQELEAVLETFQRRLRNAEVIHVADMIDDFRTRMGRSVERDMRWIQGELGGLLRHGYEDYLAWMFLPQPDFATLPVNLHGDGIRALQRVHQGLLWQSFRGLVKFRVVTDAYSPFKGQLWVYFR